MPIDWSDSPPHRHELPHLDLVTLGKNTTLEAIVTCQKMVGVNTHYISGRTLPCSQDDCPGCEKLQPKRWEGYISLYTAKVHAHIILRLTPGAADQILSRVADRNALRGTHLTVRRKGDKINGRLIVAIHDTDFGQVKLPEEPKIRHHLWNIWNLDGSQIAQEFPLFTRRLVEDFYSEPTNGTHAKPT